LTEATQGVLRGNVRLQTSVSSVLLDLEIVVPTLNNYSYTILEAIHDPATLYPVTVLNVKCHDQAEFELEVEKILSSARVRNVISSLKSQVS
jgi:hypothetical protein